MEDFKLDAAPERVSSYALCRLELRNNAELRHLWVLRRQAFSDWYLYQPAVRRGLRGWLSETFQRLEMNARALLFPEALSQVQVAEGQIVAFAMATPATWCGAPEALQTLSYYDEWHGLGRRATWKLVLFYFVAVSLLSRPALFLKLLSSFRVEKLAGCNTLCLNAIFTDSEYRGKGVPAFLLDQFKQTLPEMGYQHLIGPFRPSQYGEHKKRAGATHSFDEFRNYCEAQNATGLPVDAWLRSLHRNGMQLLKPEPRSFCMTKSLAEFEDLRASFRPDDWEEVCPGVWECGETQTWYVDDNRKSVTSVEPNYWGEIPLEGAA